MRLAPILIFAALVAASCDDIRTESRDFGLRIADFPSLPGAPPFLAVDGTLLCQEEVHCGVCGDTPPACEAVEVAVSGADADMSGCHTVELGAPLTYTFTPQGCDRALESLAVEAVAAAEVRARFNPSLTHAEELDDGYFGNPIVTQGAEAPPLALENPLQLLAASAVGIGIDVVEDATGARVGWNSSPATFTIEAITGDAPMISGDARRPQFAAGAAGARARATLNLATTDFPLADVVVVGPEVIDHLEIMALFADAGDEGRVPYGFEAHLVDADGKLIHGAEVEWEIVDGNLAIESDEDNPKSPIVGVTETCAPRDPAATRSGVIKASSGAHKASLDLSWRGYTGDGSDLPRCEGCGCRGGDPTGLGGLALGLCALGLRRRRTTRA